MKKTLLFVALIFAGMLLNAQIDDCSHTKTNWKSDKDAIETIENGVFAVVEKVIGDQESWLKSVQYYSCNDEFGFMIVKGEKKCFVHQNVPVSVWETLKIADSKGGYYNFYVKNKYKLQKLGNMPVL